jgi:glycosyltransferase involved in cell wall biosynthesis
LALLTIAVPTYNRAENLDLLLRTLAVELSGLTSEVHIIVADNASSDRTPAVIADFAKAWPSLTVLRQAVNRGPDENFCSCVEALESKYFWFIGDDDLPKTGFIAKLLDLLKAEQPDLVSFGSEWVPVIRGADQGRTVGVLRPRMLDRVGFATEVNVWMTFISGIVINRETFLAAYPLSAARRWMGTNLVQLGWVFAVLASGQRFIVLRQRCVLATAGNTGGYAVMTVFGINLPHIARSVFGDRSPEAESIVKRTLQGFLPGLAWNARNGRIGCFSDEDAWQGLRYALGRYPSFWLTLFPIMRWPRPLALPFRQLARLLGLGRRLVSLR